MNISLPRAQAAVVPEDLSGRDMVNIDDKGQYFASERQMDLRELKAYLKQRLTEVPPLIIYVRADAKTPAKQFKDVMKAAAEAGAIQVIFGTTQH
jgi:biopolymer transport protein ExbD